MTEPINIDALVEKLTDDQEEELLKLLLANMEDQTLLEVLKEDVPEKIREELVDHWEDDDTGNVADPGTQSA